MSANLQLFIEKPCSADWSNMTPEAKGRFCSLCGHTVVDFTRMTEKEIQEYFRCHSSRKTCGRFRTSQLCSHKRNSISLKSFLIGCITVLALMTGCRKPPVHKMGKVKHTMGYMEKVK